jgi:hydroxylamine reductase
MFCYQCEQTSQGTGCTRMGVCGKDADTAALQDVLLFVTKGIAMYAARAGALGARDRAIDLFVIESLFTTVTNVNFDAGRIERRIREAVEVRTKARTRYEKACAKAGRKPEILAGPAAFEPAAARADLLRQADEISIPRRRERMGDDRAGLQELVTYGLKGAAAYLDHAAILGKDDPSIYAAFHDALDFLSRDDATADELVARALDVGALNLKVMEILDAANTEAYGHPVPTRVRVTPVAGKAILVSGHDLKDLAALLEQTRGSGINIYTHGEMLPAHGYPGLKKYPHLAGNYGGAWQDQAKEFDAFPGAILMTTNCIQKPRESYRQRIFTTGLVAWPGVTHIADKDFAPVIEAALTASGFAADAPPRFITVGFGHNAVMSVAGAVVEAVKRGAIRHFFLIGGCDGAKTGRNYFTEFAQAVPEDCVILTLACGKYRFNKLEFGEVAGIPRLLDIGQCNDSYSAVQIALALGKAFNVGVNDLPLSLILSWYEQKAVAVLLTLLHLGIRNIRIGPTLPAFVTPAVLKVLVEKFAIAPVTTAEEDLARLLPGRGAA